MSPNMLLLDYFFLHHLAHCPRLSIGQENMNNHHNTINPNWALTIISTQLWLSYHAVRQWFAVECRCLLLNIFMLKAFRYIEGAYHGEGWVQCDAWQKLNLILWLVKCTDMGGGYLRVV